MKEYKQIAIYIGLFILTLFTTTISGAEWMYGRWLFYTDQTMTWSDFIDGFQFSLPFLAILTAHEFGHFFTARIHQIKVSYPYYIPFWFGFIAMPSFGTMGAFIRIRERIFSRSQYFDVGVAGPIAGFVVAIFVIVYGFSNLPDPTWIYNIHPEYEEFGLDFARYVYNEPNQVSFQFGNNLIYWWFQNYYVTDASLLPHPNEIIHYPYLLAGYLALFFTALNLLPIGQLDGGHVIFGMFGQKNARIISRGAYLLFLFYAGLGWIKMDLLQDSSMDSTLYFGLMMGIYLYFLYICLSRMVSSRRDRWMYAAIMLALQFIVTTSTQIEGYEGWMVFAFVVGRFLGVDHPPVSDNRPMTMGRQIVGWIAIAIFALSFSPKPFIIMIS
jgi:Zn-dependent protease